MIIKYVSQNVIYNFRNNVICFNFADTNGKSENVIFPISNFRRELIHIFPEKSSLLKIVLDRGSERSLVYSRSSLYRGKPRKTDRVK